MFFSSFRIKIVQYKYRPEFSPEDSGKCQTGVIAQDVRRVLPEAVSAVKGSTPLRDGTRVQVSRISNATYGRKMPKCT